MIMICLFPSGLFFDDLVQLARLSVIDEEWITLLPKIIHSRDDGSKNLVAPTPGIRARPRGSERKTTFNAPRNFFHFEKRDVPQNLNKTASPIPFYDENDVEKIKAGNYFWVTIHKDTIRKNLFFQPSQSVYNYIKRSLKAYSYQHFLEKYEYLTLLSLSLINAVKNNYYYNERLLENSLVAEHGIWKIREDNYIFKKYLESSHGLTYIEDLDIPFKELKSIFWSHDPNFLSLLEVDIANDLLKHSSNFDNPCAFKM